MKPSLATCVSLLLQRSGSVRPDFRQKNLYQAHSGRLHHGAFKQVPIGTSKLAPPGAHGMVMGTQADLGLQLQYHTPKPSPATPSPRLLPFPPRIFVSHQEPPFPVPPLPTPSRCSRLSSGSHAVRVLGASSVPAPLLSAAPTVIESSNLV